MPVLAVNFNTNSNPSGLGTTVGTTSGPAVPANPTRVGLILHNPHPSLAVAVCPAIVNQGTLGVYTGNAVGVASINGAGSITLQPGDKFILDNLSATTAWNAVGAGAGALLTALEFC